jgi:membrane associated rhomboid family serine protease
VIPLRDENPTATFPLFTILLIVANIAVFVYQVSLGPVNMQPFVERMAVIPSDISHGFPASESLTLVTSLFLHGGVLHLIFNMLFLWIFGNNIEDALGHLQFVCFYVLCGIAASLTHIFLHASSEVPVVGASGAISGVLGAYLILYPLARVLAAVPIFFFIRLIRVPAAFLLVVWIGLQVLYGLPSLHMSDAESVGGVAWFAHIGGFVAGIALLPLFLLIRRRVRRPANT